MAEPNTAAIVLEVVGAIGGSLLVLLPGWVLITVYNRGVKGPDLPERAFVLQTAFAGVFVHACMAPWSFWLAVQLLADPRAHAVAGTAWALVVLVTLPAVLGLGFGYAADLGDRISVGWLRGLAARLGISTAVRTSAAWTMAFRTLREAVFVRIHRKDGSVILGRFGTASLASSDPARKDIFLEELWSADADGWFREAYPNTSGIWIAGDGLEAVEFFSGVHSAGDEHGEKDADSR